MKTTSKTWLVSFLCLAISCTKENRFIQSSAITGENNSEALSNDIHRGGNFPSVTIGTQVWMKRNLTAISYRNGDRIPQVKDPSSWSVLTTGAWCWYNNDSANGHIYGRLYNWYAVNDPRGLAPEGWHIPSDAEWTIFSTYLGENAGGKMKSSGTLEAGTGLWHNPNTNANNSSGFTGLPGGYRTYRGGFTGIGNYANWWSSTEFSIYYPWFRGLSYFDGTIYRIIFYNKLAGLSVRLIKD